MSDAKTAQASLIEVVHTLKQVVCVKGYEMNTTQGKPHRVQRKRVKGWRLPENTVCVTRGTRWGNPFKVGVHGTAEECVAKYAKWLLPYTHHGEHSDIGSFMLSEANLIEIQAELRGKNLACFCALDQPCHADFLLEIANAKAAQTGE